ncbi:hypothetical protein OZX72_09035 [Bifidobacterium sp. ESL0769]|uniref:hypothetical protein n=1 Tax=Bifidobacterium sp. ESL0769 TaxID=2983229 RepID=UPI0023F75FCE|nr:hypothetical protein [Bifidobacterium sp. ESL0769]WEV67360.1 hypothetical protein OZX72_09035 [Bifidobacterium sp. ESL0769]
MFKQTVIEDNIWLCFSHYESAESLLTQAANEMEGTASFDIPAATKDFLSRVNQILKRYGIKLSGSGQVTTRRNIHDIRGTYSPELVLNAIKTVNQFKVLANHYIGKGSLRVIEGNLD